MTVVFPFFLSRPRFQCSLLSHSRIGGGKRVAVIERRQEKGDGSGEKKKERGPTTNRNDTMAVLHAFSGGTRHSSATL